MSRAPADRPARAPASLQEEGFRDIAPAALSPEIQAQMKTLGYVGGE